MLDDNAALYARLQSLSFITWLTLLRYVRYFAYSLTSASVYRFARLARLDGPGLWAALRFALYTIFVCMQVMHVAD